MLTKDEKGMDSIIEEILVNNPNFDDLDKLASEIHCNTIKFTNDIQDILFNID